MKQMVKAIRNIEKAIGDGIKKPTKSEIKNMQIARKSIIILKKLKRGDRISEKHLTIKRPGTGIEPKFIDLIIGKTVKKDLPADSVLHWSDLLWMLEKFVL